LTVEENLRVSSVPGRRGRWNLDAILELFPLLQRVRARPAGNLSGGEQQAVAIGRALMSNPDLLLLDEVSLGLAPVVVDAVYRSLAGILAEGATVILVEQDLGRALSVADQVVCLLEGRVVLAGEAGSLEREQIVGAYFGLRRAAAG
jgi:branched-chain amino acid transport system ATP-binding protein